MYHSIPAPVRLMSMLACLLLLATSCIEDKLPGPEPVDPPVGAKHDTLIHSWHFNNLTNWKSGQALP
ncbi:MAG: hypothetical protein V4543_15920, partial [Bacteroidota bacterium]